jgi:hypothetical protein
MIPAEMLAWLENWHDQTRNPLHAWEALTLCRPDEPLPPWVFDCFQGMARKVTALTRGDPDKAMSRVHEALGLCRPRSKNAFQRLKETAIDQRAARYVDDHGSAPTDADAVVQAGGEHFGERNAARYIERGRRLNHPKVND